MTSRGATIRNWLVAGAVALGLASGAGGGEDCRLCVEDLNGDFLVDIQDVSMVIDHWGCVDDRTSVSDRPVGLTPQDGRPVVRCTADCDSDGDVDVMDLIAVISAWGAC